MTQWSWYGSVCLERVLQNLKCSSCCAPTYCIWPISDMQILLLPDNFDRSIDSIDRRCKCLCSPLRLGPFTLSHCGSMTTANLCQSNLDWEWSIYVYLQPSECANFNFALSQTQLFKCRNTCFWLLDQPTDLLHLPLISSWILELYWYWFPSLCHFSCCNLNESEDLENSCFFSQTSLWFCPFSTLRFWICLLLLSESYHWTILACRLMNVW